MNPVFSVVIPTYNQADFLRTALRSVLDQTFQDFEVVIVNNYSTDHTLDVVADSKDERVRAINFRNLGVIGTGRNVGIKASNGAYVAFLDSDDTWYPDKLAQVAEAIRGDPQLGLICHDQMLVRDGGVVRHSRYGPAAGFPGGLYDYLLLVGNALSTSATVVARHQLEEVGLFSEDPALVTVEDYDLWIRLSKVCRYRFIENVLGTHHYHLGSASASVELHLQSTLAVLKKYLGELQELERSRFKGAIRRRYANAYYGAARQTKRNCEDRHSPRLQTVKESVGYYLRALRTYPYHLRAYAGLALLAADFLVGQSIRRRITDAIWRGA